MKFPDQRRGRHEFARCSFVRSPARPLARKVNEPARINSAPSSVAPLWPAAVAKSSSGHKGNEDDDDDDTAAANTTEAAASESEIELS